VSDRETEPRPGDPYEDWARREAEFAPLADREPDFAQRDYKPIHPQPAWRALLRTLAAPLIAFGLLFWKLKFVLVAIFKFKLFTVAGSMLVSVGAYALIWGWKFAVGFVALLFIHEMGHVFEAKRQGLKVSAPMFIPFLGALIMLRESPKSVWHEAKMAIAGPILGSLGALAAWGVYLATDKTYWLALAFVGFLLNLFNLAPIWQLDGGRVISAVHPGLWIPGLAAIGVLMFFFPSPILILIVVLGAFQAWNWWQNRHDPAQQRYYQATPRQRLAAGGMYVGLAVLLALAMNATFIEREI
jgi:Zn-dependent protease